MPITQILLTSNTTGGGGGGGGGGGLDYTFPAAGGGNYLTDTSTFGGIYVNTALQGTAYDPGSGVDSIPNVSSGWIRRRIQTGNLGGLYGAPGVGPFANPSNVVNTTTDPWGGFGFLNDGTQENYALEWLGYWQAPQTGNYNFAIQSDDRAWFWIGNNALAGTFFWSNSQASSDNGAGLNSNSIAAVSGKYYPIRMWFQEFSGAEYCQVYAAFENNTPVAMSYYSLRHNSVTLGH